MEKLFAITLVIFVTVECGLANEAGIMGKLCSRHNNLGLCALQNALQTRTAALNPQKGFTAPYILPRYAKQMERFPKVPYEDDGDPQTESEYLKAVENFCRKYDTTYGSMCSDRFNRLLLKGDKAEFCDEYEEKCNTDRFKNLASPLKENFVSPRLHRSRVSQNRQQTNGYQNQQSQTLMLFNQMNQEIAVKSYCNGYYANFRDFCIGPTIPEFSINFCKGYQKTCPDATTSYIFSTLPRNGFFR